MFKPQRNVATGQKISAMPRNKYGILGKVAAALQLVHRWPVLKMRNGRKMPRRSEVALELWQGRPRAPPGAGIGHQFPAKTEIVCDLTRYSCFPIAFDAVTVAKDVATTEIAKHHADEPRIVPAAQGNHDLTISGATH